MIDEPRPLAFCAGCLHPRVYLSTGAIARLEPTQLRAVLAHEAHHRACRDPLRVALADALSGAVFFLPGRRQLSARCRSQIELDADFAALQTGHGDLAPLAGALLVMSEPDEPGAAVCLAPERVDQLIGREPSWRAPFTLLAVEIVTLAAVAGTIVETARDASIQTSFALPLISAAPCIVILAIIPLSTASLDTQLLNRPARDHARHR